jgi:hypothetical protein
MPPRLAAIDLEPTSEVRPMEGRVRRLLVDTGLRGADAEAAWVTVSGADGVIHFEGAPAPDGCVEVSFLGAPAVESAHVQLETSTLHRQAEVKLGEGLTSYAFA